MLFKMSVFLCDYIIMESFYRKLPFAAVGLILFLSPGCGKDEQEQVVVIPDSPPQIVITLRSDINFEQPLEPDPQIDKSAGQFPDLGKKKRVILGRKKPPLPAFKADEGYQSIKRFERVSPDTFEMSFEKKPASKKKRGRKTVKLQDKPLVFGGRGFNIKAFDRALKPAVDVDYALHLREPVPPVLPVGPADHLDPNGEYSKDTKGLIYGETRIAFGKMPPPLAESEPVESKAPVSVPAEKHPNSVLAFPPGEESIAVISKDKNSLDLLAGNETLNKKRFRSE